MNRWLRDFEQEREWRVTEKRVAGDGKESGACDGKESGLGMDF